MGKWSLLKPAKKEEATKIVYTKGSNELSNAKSGTTAYTDLAKKAQDEMKLSDEDMSSYLYIGNECRHSEYL